MDEVLKDSADSMCVQLSPDVLFRQLREEAVLLDLETQRYFGLDEVGARLWSLLAEDPRLERAQAALLLESDVEAETLARDVDSFLAELAAKGLVRLRPAS